MKRAKSTWLLRVAQLAAVWLIWTSAPRSHHAIHVEPDRWQTGDILFIDGASFRSCMVRFLQGYSTDYSHVGVIVVVSGVPFVVHADPAAGHVVEERWDVTLSPERAVGGAVYRFRAATPAITGIVAMAVRQYAKEHVPFDHDFDLHKPGRLYCTELVWRAYEKAGIDLRLPEDSQCVYILPAYLLNPAKLEKVASF